jgi:2-polyprenyl-3-methyl-5-hydroxy-6-metoxy-1,4-benzoquinol methylase
MPLAPADFAAIAATCQRTWDRHYTGAKLRTDPVYGAVEDLLRSTTLRILDIGCGLGLLAQWLRKSGIQAPISGFDYDPRKIASAKTMAKDLAGVHFSSGDARTELPEHHGHVVILDILQFFTLTEQGHLLAAAAQRVAPGAKLIIRNGLQGDSWRYRVTVACDWIAKLSFWMKAAPVVYPSAVQLRSALEAQGLVVTITPLWGRTPFYNHLIVASRPAQQ